MKTGSVRFQLEADLKSRSATDFTQKAAEFKSGIWLEKGNRRANAKSLLGVLSLSVTSGDELAILADGEDEDAAVEALTEYLAELQ